MNKKGFTLVELLAVIILLVVIFILIVPGVNNIINNGREVTYDFQINKILNASYDWSLKNASKLPDKDKTIFITLAHLKKAGLIDSSLINPNTKNEFENDLVISISNVGSNYDYKSEYAKKAGDYLYKIKLDSNTINPIIVLDKGTPDSNGNYFTNIDLNSNYTLPNYSATSNNIDIKDLVVVNIFCEGNLVDTIDTSVRKIYKVNYTVVDSLGNSINIVNNVIVADITPPQIIIPKDTELESTVREFDLMQGVSCEDNSDYCTITYSGKLELGKVGTYVITYTAKDTNSNTSTLKRVITVK